MCVCTVCGLTLVAFCECKPIAHRQRPLSVVEREGAFAWSLQTPPLGQTCPDHQYTARLELRLRLAAGATCSVQAQYDADGTWRPCGSITAASDALFTFPIRPHRCAQCQLRLTGTGDVTLYSITRSTTEGSERG